MKLLPFARVCWPQIGVCLPFLAPEFDFLLLVFTIQQFSKQLQSIFHSLRRFCSSYTSSGRSSSGDRCTTPWALKKVSVERLKILKPAATYGWKESSESRNPPGSVPGWKETWPVDEVLGSGEMPAAQKVTSFLLLQTNPTRCRTQRADERYWEICYPSLDICSTERK